MIEKHKSLFKGFEDFDKVGYFDSDKKRVNLFLERRTINRLKEVAKEENKSVSKVVEERFWRLITDGRSKK